MQALVLLAQRKLQTDLLFILTQDENNRTALPAPDFARNTQLSLISKARFAHTLNEVMQFDRTLEG